MNGDYYIFINQEDLILRNSAVEKAFRDNDIDSAINMVSAMAQKNPILFKFYRPRQHSIQALLDSEIYMCRPSTYEDSGDNEYLPNMESISKYYVEEVKKNPIPSLLFGDGFYENMSEQINANPNLIQYKKRIQDDFLTACITENFDEKMWADYAQDGEGFCVVYGTNQLIVESHKLGYFFYPVRYVKSRKACDDIQFTANEYKDTEQSYQSFLHKIYLSCLTKDILPYSSEREWRLMMRNPGLLENENGKTLPFIQPFMIIAGENIGKNPEIEKSLIDASKQLGIELKKVSDYNNLR